MEFAVDFLMRDALAQGAPGGDAPVLINLLFPILLLVAFYFLLIRPQTKRAKEHRQMVEGLKKGDEIVTGGGLLGRILEVGDNFLLVEVANNVQLRIQKHTVSSLMPKGTMKGDL
ncbi:MAG: preprotein translocase subunit YajC [Candidatus Competibacterales bacterium]